MKKQIITLAIATLAATSAHAQAGPTTDQAISIAPSYSTSTRTECSTAAPVGGGWLGPAIGAILGGGAGSQIGSGSGQAAAAAIGATLGAQAGAAMSSNSGGSAQPGTQTCRDVVERTLVGYMIRTTGGSVFVPLSLVQQFNNGNGGR